MPTIQRIFDIIDDLYELLTETKNRGHLNLTLHDKRQLEDLITRHSNIKLDYAKLM